jgi:imidazolonepropionase-like amidohydrolase
MSLILENCSVITGDGRTELGDARIIIKNGRIENLGEDLGIPKDHERTRRIDLDRRLVIPGIINHHEHHITGGPNIMGDMGLSQQDVFAHLDRHLSQGTTTICNVDGFITMDDLEATSKNTKINLKTATIHNKHMIEAARIISGCPSLSNVHTLISIEEMAQRGAVAIGEVEEMTIWGVLVYLPMLLFKLTGKRVDPMVARRLQQAVLGDLENIPEFNPERIADLIRGVGLEGAISAKELKDFLERLFLTSHHNAYKAYVESASDAEQTGLPMIVHTALESRGWVLELARNHSRTVRIIASHCDSITFDDANDALDNALQLKKAGATIDCTSYMPNHETLSEKGITLFKNGLVDTICTDAGGGHDSILFFIERLVENNLVKLPEAIRMATYNVATAIPKLAPKRGLVSPGMIADLAIVDRGHVGSVEKVIIDGRIAVDDGWKSGAWKSYGISSPLERWYDRNTKYSR